MDRRMLVAPLLCIFGSIVSCSNRFSACYEDYLEEPIVAIPALIPHSGDPEIQLAENSDADWIKLFEAGFLMIGRSEFNSRRVSLEDAGEHARHVRAAVVLVTETYVDTTTRIISRTRDERITSNTIGSYRGTYSRGTYSATTTTTVPTTTYHHISVDSYDYDATFWVKSKPRVFGAGVRDLSPEIARALQRNRGVEVFALRRDSPAFMADILRGDIIIKVAGRDVIDEESLQEILKNAEGTRVEVLLNRSGKEITIPVQLGGRAQ